MTFYLLMFPRCHSGQKNARPGGAGRGRPCIPESSTCAAVWKESVVFPVHGYLPSCTLNHRDHRSGETGGCTGVGWGENFPGFHLSDEYLHLILFVCLLYSRSASTSECQWLVAFVWGSCVACNEAAGQRKQSLVGPRDALTLLRTLVNTQCKQHAKPLRLEK